MNTKIKLMLVEDDPEYRHVIQFALRKDTTLELIRQFASAEQAIHSFQNPLKDQTPDVTLLDLNLPGISGLEALPKLLEQIPDSKIIVLTQSEKKADVLSAINQGASGYLLKSSTVQEIRSAIRSAMSGGAPLDPKMAKFILTAVKSKAIPSDTYPELSERETEILLLISQGLARKEICAKLEISVKTVDNHIAHIFEKMDVPNAPAAISKAYRSGLFDSP